MPGGEAADYGGQRPPPRAARREVPPVPPSLPSRPLAPPSPSPAHALHAPPHRKLARLLLCAPTSLLASCTPPPGGVLPAGVLPMRSSTRLGQAAEMPSASSLAPSPVTSATSPRSDSDTIVQLLGCRASTPLFDTPSATRTGLYRFSCPGTERWRRGPRTGVSRPRRRAAAVHVRTQQARTQQVVCTDPTSTLFVSKGKIDIVSRPRLCACSYRDAVEVQQVAGCRGREAALRRNC